MPQLKASLLLVDDDAATRHALADSFVALGYRVRSAADGFGALDLIRKEMPDIILSDLQMPGMSGFEFLYVVQRRFPAIRVVAMSGAYSGDKIPEGAAAHAFHAKGTSPRALFETIEAMAEHRRESIQKTSGITLIWIARNIHDCSGQAYVLIGCPECLRTFPELLTRERAVHEAECIYCGTFMRYAIVQQALATLPPPPHSRLGREHNSARELATGSRNLLSSQQKGSDRGRKMIEKLKETRGPAYGFAVRGVLTTADTDFLSQELDHAIGNSTKPIGLLADLSQMAEADWSARWQEMRFLQKHSGQIARFAVVGTSDWEELTSMLLVATAALQAQTLYLKHTEIAHAWHWVKMGKHDDEMPVRVMYPGRGLFQNYTPEYMGI